MRLTVGPLPPAVYWRRRAVVLGAVLLFLVVVLYSCANAGGSSPRGGAKGSPTPSGSATPSGPVLTPETGAPPSGGADQGEEAPDAGAPAGEEPVNGEPVGSGPDDVGIVPSVPPPGGADVCTDNEMSVTPVPSQNSMKRGVTIEIRLKIKNVSNRTCTRDVGADLQEVYVRIGAEKIWSSDTCGAARGTDPRSFTPGLEHEYRVAWNGKKSTSCAGQAANGETAAAGTYQLFGRLGSKLSEPVKLTVTN